jgi:hypothetical protein
MTEGGHLAAGQPGRGPGDLAHLDHAVQEDRQAVPRSRARLAPMPSSRVGPGRQPRARDRAAGRRPDRRARVGGRVRPRGPRRAGAAGRTRRPSSRSSVPACASPARARPTTRRCRRWPTSTTSAGRYLLQREFARLGAPEPAGVPGQPSPSIRRLRRLRGLASAHTDLGTVLIGATPAPTRSTRHCGRQRRHRARSFWPKAHSVLGRALMGQWRWKSQEAAFRRAPRSIERCGRTTGLREWLIAHHRGDEAVASARQGRDLDPL